MASRRQIERAQSAHTHITAQSLHVRILLLLWAKVLQRKMATRSRAPGKNNMKSEHIEAESTYCYGFPNLHLRETGKKIMIVIDLFQLSIFDSFSLLHSLSFWRIWIIASKRSSSSCVQSTVVERGRERERENHPTSSDEERKRRRCSTRTYYMYKNARRTIWFGENYRSTLDKVQMCLND